MPITSAQKLIRDYSFVKREKLGLTKKAEKFVKKSFRSEHMLLIGYGGTISSGYTPTYETIVPLAPSPAKKSIDYINIFSTQKIETDHIPLLDKDSREVTDDDMYLLFDILMLCPNEKVLITVGTYLGPKITESLFLLKDQLGNMKIITTGSILPAGFLASDAEANIWSAISILNYISKHHGVSSFVAMVFHGNTYSNQAELDSLDLHPDRIKDIVIQYPLSTIPIAGII